MAPGWNVMTRIAAVSLVSLLALLTGPVACSSSSSTTVDGIYVGSATTPEQRSAIKTAHRYLEERRSTDKNDRYSATPFNNGWVVRIERLTELTAGGQREVDPSSIRMITIDAQGNVVDYMPGAYVPVAP